MSRRNHGRRRRAYGPRQHELAERRVAQDVQWSRYEWPEYAWTPAAEAQLATPRQVRSAEAAPHDRGSALR